MAPLIPIALQLASMAPTVMRYFGAGEPAASVVDRVVQVAQQVTGAATPAQAVQQLQADPALVLQYQQRLIEIDGELERAYLGDRADARRRDVALAQAGRRNTRADVMVVMDVVGLVACLAVLALFRDQIPTEVVTLLSTIAGIFGLCLRDAHQFEFGSSRGSKEKDQLLAQINPAGIKE